MNILTWLFLMLKVHINFRLRPDLICQKSSILQIRDQLKGRNHTTNRSHISTEDGSQKAAIYSSLLGWINMTYIWKKSIIKRLMKICTYKIIRILSPVLWKLAKLEQRSDIRRSCINDVFFLYLMYKNMQKKTKSLTDM